MRGIRFMLGTLVAFLAVAALATQPGWTADQKPLAGYSVLVVEKFTVESNGATEEFPKGHEVLLQQGSVERLRKKKVFSGILDAADPAATKESGAPAATETARRLILSGTVIAYDKGSRAGRWAVGFGAGATKVKVRFTFRDAETGDELLRTDRQGKFYGTFSFAGGSSSHAVSEAAGDVVDGLIRDIAKNR